MIPSINANGVKELICEASMLEWKNFQKETPRNWLKIRSLDPTTMHIDTVYSFQGNESSILNRCNSIWEIASSYYFNCSPMWGKVYSIWNGETKIIIKVKFEKEKLAGNLRELEKLYIDFINSNYKLNQVKIINSALFFKQVFGETIDSEELAEEEKIKEIINEFFKTSDAEKNYSLRPIDYNFFRIFDISLLDIRAFLKSIPYNQRMDLAVEINRISKGIKREIAIVNQEAIFDFAKILAKKNPSYLFDNINEFGIDTQHKFIEILEIASDFRSDLVLKLIFASKFEDQSSVNNIILKCINHVPYIAANSKEVNIWINEHQDLLSADMQAILMKIINEAQISPNREMQKVFEQIQAFAKDPGIQLIGRISWFQYSENPELEMKKSISLELNNDDFLTGMASSNNCGTTVKALKYAIFGITALNKMELEEDTYRKEELDKVWSLINENEIELKNRPISHFFAYQFQCAAIDHGFSVIQHRDEQQNIKYRILQSWLEQHSLHDYIINRSRSLSSDEFAEFAKGLNHTLFHEEHTYLKDIFYEHYFMSKDNLRNYPKNSTLKMEWGSSNLELMNDQINQFETFLKAIRIDPLQLKEKLS